MRMALHSDLQLQLQYNDTFDCWELVLLGARSVQELIWGRMYGPAAVMMVTMHIMDIMLLPPQPAGREEQVRDFLAAALHYLASRYPSLGFPHALDGDPCWQAVLGFCLACLATKMKPGGGGGAPATAAEGDLDRDGHLTAKARANLVKGWLEPWVSARNTTHVGGGLAAACWHAHVRQGGGCWGAA
jgi:hypothetical protein